MQEQLKPYLFSHSPMLNPEYVHYVLNNTNAIRNWVAPFPFCAIVISSLETKELGAILRHHFPGAWLIVSELRPDHVDGWLPGDFWKYITQPADPTQTFLRSIPETPNLDLLQTGFGRPRTDG